MGQGEVGPHGTPASLLDQTVLTVTGDGLRIDARYGVVVRRRHALLPLLV